ncbi:MAG: transcriptional repressor [Treponema sp.]|jgi:Fur family ferric uptake transcriptional regulator|nr:transcriptional repressor [Treponema sp.]
MVSKRPANYRTRQGKCILDYLKSLKDGHATAGQIARHFERAGEAVGQTTVYRHLEKLTTLGIIHKHIQRDDKSAWYQYIDGISNCREHFHLKCKICGHLIHMDCEFLNETGRHLLSKHEFRLDTLKTVFYGTCKKCAAGAGIQEHIH